MCIKRRFSRSAACGHRSFAFIARTRSTLAAAVRRTSCLSNLISKSNRVQSPWRSRAKIISFFCIQSTIANATLSKGKWNLSTECHCMRKADVHLRVCRFWGAANRAARQECDYSYKGLCDRVPAILDNVPLRQIRRFSRKAWRYIESYAAGQDVYQAEDSEKTLRKEKRYKSHRRVREND